MVGFAGHADISLQENAFLMRMAGYKMTVTESKSEYIEHWKSYIEEIWRLGFCSDPELYKGDK